MKPDVIETKNAPAAVGAYSQAVRSGGFVFVSGQIPLEPATGNLIEGDIRAQTERALQNMTAIVHAAGSRLDQVVKVELFLADINDFAAVNEVYGEFFRDARPARQAVGVAGLPKGAEIEVSCIAMAE
ncbi:MAG: RidA family protein [Thermodesulfobacteriota bacterium]